jgi:beta-glucosidase
MKKITFPRDFLWGGATSSHQVEGGNVNNDWWAFEQIPGKIVDGSISGDACDHYNRFHEDFRLLKRLNHNAHRLSLEWSRIEPSKGYYSNAALAHYEEVFKTLKKLGIEPMVTLHHFTTPLWMAREGGWANRDIIKRFEDYTRVVADAFGGYVRLWLPINEPMVYAFLTYFEGVFAPGVKNPMKGFRVASNMLRAHAGAYRIIKRMNPDAQVGFNKHMRVFDPLREGKRLDSWVAGLQDKNFNMDIMDALNTGETSGRIRVAPEDKNLLRKSMDFIGLNYYSRDHVRFSLLSPMKMFGKTIVPEGVETTHPGATGEDKPEGEIYSHGLYRLIGKLSKYDVPVYITENGLAAEDDQKRVKYMADHIVEVGRAIKDGMDVRGYLFWSTLDNFEWNEGYTMRFGMIQVDFDTQKRRVKPSGRMFAEIARQNAIDDATLKKYGVTMASE